MDIQIYENLTLDEQIKEKEHEAYSEGYDNAVELYGSQNHKEAPEGYIAVYQEKNTCTGCSF